jgi:rubrerythrin
MRFIDHLSRGDKMAKEEIPLVNVIASGYEWICPECGYFHEIIEFPHSTKTRCQGCGLHVELDIPEHAME